MYIESVKNPRIKAWRRLKTRKARWAERRFLVEGVRLVEEVLRSSLEVEAVLWDVSSPDPPESLAAAAQDRGVPLFELAPRAFAEVADTVTPQGVMAIARMPLIPAAPLGAWTLLLDDVHDPGNAGTLLRTADAFAVSDVVFGDGTVDPYAPKVVRASMGGLFRVSVRVGSSIDAIRQWQARWPEGQVLLADAGGTRDCTAVDWRRPTLLVIGGEARGAGAAVRAAVDDAVRVPMEPAADSLNAAMAGTVLLYESYRQRRQVMA